jgi:hypothetical protein
MLILVFLFYFFCATSDTHQYTANYFKDCLKNIQKVETLNKSSGVVFPLALDQCTNFMSKAFTEFNSQHDLDINQMIKFKSSINLTYVDGLLGLQSNFYPKNKEYIVKIQPLLRAQWEDLPQPEQQFFSKLILEKLNCPASLMKKKKFANLEQTIEFRANCEILNYFYCLAQPEGKKKESLLLQYYKHNKVEFLLGTFFALDIAISCIRIMQNTYASEIENNCYKTCFNFN